MKKILGGITLFSIFVGFTYGDYTPTKSDLQFIEAAKIKIDKLYDSNPNKAYNVEKNIDKFYSMYAKKEQTIFVLDFIKTTTESYIKAYEEKIKKEEEDQQKQQNNQNSQNNQQNEVTMLPDFNDVIVAQNNKLKVMTETDDTKILATFNIEPQYDHIYLKNVYFENIGTVYDMSNLFQTLYLVDEEDRIVSTGYVMNNYLYFDINTNYALQQNKVRTFYVKAILRQPSSKNQVGELKFEISTPNGASVGALNGIRATSYSNGSYVTIDIDKNINPITTLVSYSNSYVERDEAFVSAYSQVMGFRLYNNSKNRMDVKKFELEVSGSFLSGISLDTAFVVKIKGSNQIFGTGIMKNMAGNKLTITYGGGDAPNYISAYSYTDYIIEIDNKGTPKGKREIRLNNIEIGDGFGGTISNLNGYNGTGLPTDFAIYDY